jgi:hypothetical protein
MSPEPGPQASRGQQDLPDRKGLGTAGCRDLRAQDQEDDLQAHSHNREYLWSGDNFTFIDDPAIKAEMRATIFVTAIVGINPDAVDQFERWYLTYTELSFRNVRLNAG